MNIRFHTAGGAGKLPRKSLTVAIAGTFALAFSAGAFAQAVNGTIRGTVPVAANESIQITGKAGYQRTLGIDADGSYAVKLPVGTYTVSLLQNGAVVQTRSNVSPVAAGAVTVNFTTASGAVQTLSSVSVSASRIPPIDVTTTNQVTTVTSQQLQQLPLARTAEGIALLAPGVTAGAPALGGSNALGTPLLAFGGASVAENAYYLDGMNTTDALTGQGGISLPYGAIKQQQIITTGYGAKYGRSIGGVINQIGKSGGNEWHFGGQITWRPASMRAAEVNSYWNNPHSDRAGQQRGDLHTWRRDNDLGETVYDAYVSGPIIKDKLSFFLSVEKDQQKSDAVTSASDQHDAFYDVQRPKIYAKINWNITPNNYLSVTGVENSTKTWQSNYDYAYATHTEGAFSSHGVTHKNSFKVWVANYTSYLSDNLTLHAMVGQMRGKYVTYRPTFPGFDPDLPAISGASNQNPDHLPPGSHGITNANGNITVTDPAHSDRVTNYRLSLEWMIGDHDISVGIDNINTQDSDDGNLMTGPGYAWVYKKYDPSKYISGSPGSLSYVGRPDTYKDGQTGYVVERYTFTNVNSVKVRQKAAYVEDNWQVTPRLLLNLGLRDDAFTNYNAAGQPYIRLTKPQWAPRVGFSWDVFGDASMKIYGNAGRYYLALPAGPALRVAGISRVTKKFYTYNRIDADGVPHGLNRIPQAPASGLSRQDNGKVSDPRTIAAKDVKAEYSDNYVLGLQKQFSWHGVPLVFGVNGVYQHMGRILDDWDDQCAIGKAAVAQGFTNFGTDPSVCTPAMLKYITEGILVNPGLKQTLVINDPDGSLDEVVVTGAEQGFPEKAKREYYALNVSLSHPWDGKWFAKVLYTFSRVWGNTEGPVDSSIGQGGNSVSITEPWDFWQLMEHASGPLPNDQRHQFKAYGAYALTPEWIVGANLSIASGHPNTCLGYYGPSESDPLNYGQGYHWCDGHASAPGASGYTPWTHQLDLNVTYRPTWAKRKLKFNLAVFNVFNQQTPLQYNSAYGRSTNPNPSYMLVDGWTQPRYLRLSVAYDW